MGYDNVGLLVVFGHDALMLQDFLSFRSIRRARAGDDLQDLPTPEVLAGVAGLKKTAFQGFSWPVGQPVSIAG